MCGRVPASFLVGISDSQKRRQIVIHRPLEIRPIIETRSTPSSIVDRETERTDEVEHRPGGHAEPAYRPGILGNPGLYQHDMKTGVGVGRHSLRNLKHDELSPTLGEDGLTSGVRNRRMVV